MSNDQIVIHQKELVVIEENQVELMKNKINELELDIFDLKNKLRNALTFRFCKKCGEHQEESQNETK